jgi:hypothetical protein
LKLGWLLKELKEPPVPFSIVTELHCTVFDFWIGNGFVFACARFYLHHLGENSIHSLAGVTSFTNLSVWKKLWHCEDVSCTKYLWASQWPLGIRNVPVHSSVTVTVTTVAVTWNTNILCCVLFEVHESKSFCYVLSSRTCPYFLQ